MKLLRISFAVFFLLLFCLTALADVKQKTFTKEEIKKMAETRAIIETKFGNIDLKFFPDVAPGHVNNFIELIMARLDSILPGGGGTFRFAEPPAADHPPLASAVSDDVATDTPFSRLDPMPLEEGTTSVPVAVEHASQQTVRVMADEDLPRGVEDEQAEVDHVVSFEPSRSHKKSKKKAVTSGVVERTGLRGAGQSQRRSHRGEPRPPEPGSGPRRACHSAAASGDAKARTPQARAGHRVRARGADPYRVAVDRRRPGPAPRLKVLGVTTARRSAALPDVPPLAEAADIPGYDAAAWIGYAGPAGTPRDILVRLSAEIQKAVQAADLRERYVTLGLDTASNTPDGMMAMMRREQDRYASIIKTANIKIDK